MRRIVSFILFVVLLITVGGCLWVHEREGEEHDRGGRREHMEHERGEHYEHEDMR